MTAHGAIVHYALQERKCLLNRSSRYRESMQTPNERLRQARINAGYSTSDEAADALGVNRNTYRQHENDTRGLGGIPRQVVPLYSRRFKVSVEWLMTGKETAVSDGDAERIATLVQKLPVKQRDIILELIESMSAEGE